MVEVRLQIPDDLADKLQEKIGGKYKITDMARDAMTLFTWAVDERAKGRLVLSSDDEGTKMVRMTMPSIEQAAPKSDPPSGAK